MSAAVRFSFLGSQELVQDSSGIRAISVRGSERFYCITHL